MAFPEQRDRELIRRAEALVERSTELTEWLADFNPVRRSNDLAPISDRDEFEAISLRRTAVGLYNSARVPAAAAVYGPSQVGKSLLIGSVLEPADPEYSPLGRDDQLGAPAYFRHLSFTNDLNPQSGSNEATALVTRFTTKDRMRADIPSRYPVLVRSLSRSQWMRVLARGFMVECEQDDTIFDEATLESLISHCESAESATERGWRVDLLDTYQYVKRHAPLRYQASEAFLNGLLSRYALSSEGCVQLAAALCWGNWPTLTALFRRVANLIERVTADGADGILSQWACVRFLLDSQRASAHQNKLSRCFDSVQWSDVQLVPCEEWLALDYEAGRGGGDVDLATLQAAMLELVVPVLPHRMNEHWSKVVEEFDLLDIPGMRAGREGSSDGLRSSAESVTEQMEIVKRGKVQYLFDRYIEERQVQTLLLLARGGNLEVRGQMKGYVTKWGRTRYGNAWPEAVSDDPPALFIGLTGIDEEFRNRSSYPGPELYDNRLRQLVDTLDRNLQDFGGQGRTFRNVYPLRYPGTWDTNAEQREADDPQKWKHAGASFVESEWVRKYVAEPERRWEAAMRDGDGGLSLISRGLRSTTDSSAKQSDLERAIAETEERLGVLASSWIVPADANLERQRRAELARGFVDWLTRDRGKAYIRFHVVNQSLCLAEGDTLPIADFADLNWGLARITSEPIEKRFASHLRVFLDDWSASLAPSRWRQYCAQYEVAGAPWLTLDQFHHLVTYLRDFLVTEPVFDSLCQRLLSVIQIRLRDEAACRQARRKYTRMILNDFILQPGPPDREVVASSDSIEVEGESHFGSLLPVLQHWSHSLPACLGQGAGEEVVVPAGNEALNELLEDWN